MPHDKHGKVLSIGSKVLIPATVTAISGGEDYCNVACQSDEKMHPGEHYSTFSLNAKQVISADEDVRGTEQEVAHDDTALLAGRESVETVPTASEGAEA